MSRRDEGLQLLLAWQFLTRIPLPARATAWIDRQALADGELTVGVRHFATIGLILGCLAAGLLWLTQLLWPAPVAVVVTIGAMIWLTGAFHEDGLADTCDALGGHVGRERALAIMRDSRIGTYGAAGLWVVLTGRAVLLTALAPTWALWALVVAQPASRAAAMTMMYLLPYVADPASSKAVSRMRPVRGQDLDLGWGVVAAAAVVAALATGRLLPWLAALSAIIVGAIGLGYWFRRRLGGYTGDCLGATQQLTELLCLAALLACLGPAGGSA